MAHFAKVNKVTNIVEDVIVANLAFIATLPEEQDKDWIQTSYNTREGVHSEGGIPLRKNFAIIGGTYDYSRDAFIPPKEFDSWVLDEDKAVWVAPIEKPEGNFYWDEATETWKNFGPSGTPE
jgi:hypothetical protein